jgi:hypothetical protein
MAQEIPETDAWKLDAAGNVPLSIGDPTPHVAREYEQSAEDIDEIGYVNPDEIYGQGNPKVTFYYGDMNGKTKFISGDGNITHWNMMEDYWSDLNGREIRERSIRSGLIGRIGEFCPRKKCHYWLSLWNDNRSMIDKMMGGLVQELKSRKYPYYSESMIVSTLFGNQSIQNYESISRKSKYTPEEIASMQKRMHGARGEEKKALRKALGLWSDKPAEPGLYGQMMKHRFDPEVAKWWTPECNLNFREYAEVFSSDLWEERRQQIADVTKAINKLTYGKGLDVDDISKMPVRELMDFLDTDSPRFAAMVKSVASGAAETESKEPNDYEPPWKSIV